MMLRLLFRGGIRRFSVPLASVYKKKITVTTIPIPISFDFFHFVAYLAKCKCTRKHPHYVPLSLDISSDFIVNFNCLQWLIHHRHVQGSLMVFQNSVKLLVRGKIYLISMTSTRASSGIRTALSYCVQQVRSYDYQHYLCLLELPPNMRKSAFALRAFNVETARAMDVASDPRIGLMRLLWWQEAIDKIFSNQLIEHPVAQALASVVSEHKVSKSWLKRSVEARITDARREPTNIPETVEELERYAEDTISTILYSTLQAGGIRSTTADHAASHIGKASGLALLLKSLPYHASKNRHFSYIPAKVAEKHGLLVNQGGRSEIHMDSREGLCNVVFEMASVANAHLLKARELAKAVPREAHPVLLPAVPTQVILDSLSRVQFDVFDPRLSRGVLGVSPLWYQLKLKWLSWRGKY